MKCQVDIEMEQTFIILSSVLVCTKKKNYFPWKITRIHGHQAIIMNNTIGYFNPSTLEIWESHTNKDSQIKMSQ